MVKVNKLSLMMILMLTGLFVQLSLTQPQITTPRPSQAAVVEQQIGISKIKISYHRPGVNDREIWGALVPYNQVWRAGANENTTIYFSDPVKIEGTDLAAGKYGLHMIPTENEWTIIFSTVNTEWGSFGYNEAEDALRVNVKPESAPFEERLNYRFDDPAGSRVVVALYWEKLRIPFTVDIDVPQRVVENIRKELRGQPQFFWQAWSQAANYCLQNDLNLEQAMGWIDRSIQMNENFTNLRVKSDLLRKVGKEKTADEIMGKALTIATENEMNQYGYQLLFGGEVDKAIEVFKNNVKDHPESWNVYDSLGEGYATKGDSKNAKKYYRMALQKVQDETQKARIEGVLNNLD